MSNTPDDADFAESFLDDFFAESEEHLTSIRRSLLALDAALTRGTSPAGALDEMFRSFHSLKGIAGMVELDRAELLAHDMESYLRAVRDGDLALSRVGLEALMDGTRALDAVVAAHKDKTPPPDIEDTRRSVAALIPPSTSTAGSGRALRDAAMVRDPDPAPVPEPGAEADGLSLWHVTFVPSTDLLARGVNVNTVRDRLLAVGEILSARPTVTPSGGIAFQFEVTSGADPDIFERWRDEGITATREDVDAAPPRLRGAPAEPAATQRAPLGVQSVASKLVRVDLTRLDDVMRIVAELVVSRGRLEDQLLRVALAHPELDVRALGEASEAIDRQLRELRASVMRARLVPIREIFGRMPFVVRDLARDNQKQVKLDLRGQDTEIDKFVIERLMDPILHLVRNAISHGIELPAERVARGKPAVGTVGLHAATVGDTVLIEVEDDGCGIDRAAVLARARALGLDAPEGGDTRGMLDLLCGAGFSTREEADRASGRGVGMAVVKQVVERLSGSLDLYTEPGRGTRFTISVPVTLAIIDALICRIGGQRFAVPQSAVREVLALAAADVRALENNEIFPYRDGVLPLVRAERVLGLDAGASKPHLHVFVIGQGPQAVGLGVDRILGQRDVVVRAVGDPLLRVDGIAGATDLGDGMPVLILDPPALVRLRHARAEAPAYTAARELKGAAR
ncbi:MAG: chemotaxis protein CheA [Bacteroidales bacterium]